MIKFMFFMIFFFNLFFSVCFCHNEKKNNKEIQPKVINQMSIMIEMYKCNNKQNSNLKNKAKKKKKMTGIMEN